MGWLQKIGKIAHTSHMLWVYGCSMLGSHGHVFYKELTCSASEMEICPPEAVSRQECLSPSENPPQTETRSSGHNCNLAIDASKSHYFQGLSQVRDARTMKEILVDLRIHGS